MLVEVDGETKLEMNLNSVIKPVESSWCLVCLPLRSHFGRHPLCIEIFLFVSEIVIRTCPVRIIVEMMMHGLEGSPGEKISSIPLCFACSIVDAS